MTIQAYRQKIEQQKGRMCQVHDDLKQTEKDIEDARLYSVYCEEAQTIVQNVAQLTQQELEYHVSELVSLALAAVFDEPYELSVEFTQRRGRTEADLWFVRDGKKIDPLGASGGGAVDVASFGLMVALWSLAPVKTRPVLFMDEPLKWLKGGQLPERGASMIKEISEKLGLQVVMISHIPDQIEGSDRRISVALDNGVSRTSIQ